MKDRREQPGLDEVLEAFIASTEEPNKDSLAEWIRRYPQYARELTDFAAHWSLTRWMPPHEGSAEEEDRMILHGISAAQDVLHRRQAEREMVVEEASIIEEVPIIGLFEESKRKGMTRSQFAEATELSVSLLAMLDRRLCDFNSIHTKVIEKVSQVLGQSYASIASYLNREATFAVAAHRKSGKLPKLAEKQDFFEAVRHDPHIKEEWRQNWLALAPRGSGGQENSSYGL
jgi:transcriptional regulator with XRE-family HTH domain